MYLTSVALPFPPLQPLSTKYLPMLLLRPVIVSPTSGQVVAIRENQDAGSIVCGVQISDADSGDNGRVSSIRSWHFGSLL